MISRKDESLISVWAGNPYGLSCFWFQMPFNHESMLCKKVYMINLAGMTISNMEQLQIMIL